MLEVNVLPKPQGPRVLVEVVPTEEVSEGGIVVVSNIKDKRREEQAQMVGIVKDIGHTCWHEPVGDGQPWAKVGDKVLFAKFSGPEFKLKNSDKLYRIMNDEDLIAILEEGENYHPLARDEFDKNMAALGGFKFRREHD